VQGRPLSAGRGLLRRRGGGGLASAAAIVRFVKWRGGGIRRWGGDGSGRKDQSEPIAGRKRTGALDLRVFFCTNKRLEEDWWGV